MNSSPFGYAFGETADADVGNILLTIPARWGRMPPLSRAVVVEAGRILQHNAVLESLRIEKDGMPAAGLIGATRWGSYTTDLAFAASMKLNAEFASPALFGYTLANVPLAEAANHFGLTGPVYALIAADDPLAAAAMEARQHLRSQPYLKMMLACGFDAYYHDSGLNAGQDLQLSVTFTLLQKR